ncbi:MAG: MoaD/ThiS family protein [Desulfobacterales bacterium]|jgi:sulfur carrier protein ThiS
MAGFIRIKLFATLAPKLPADADRYPIGEQTSVADVLADLQIPENQAKLIFVNGRKTAKDVRLEDGDRLGVFPPVGGG